MAKIWLIGWNGENRSKIITVINEWITCLPNWYQIVSCHISTEFSVDGGTCSKSAKEVWPENPVDFPSFDWLIRIIWIPYFYRIVILNRFFSKLIRIWRQKIPETQRRKEQPVVPTPPKKNIVNQKTWGAPPSSSFILHLPLNPVPSTSVRPGLDNVTYSQTWSHLVPPLFFSGGFFIGPFSSGLQVEIKWSCFVLYIPLLNPQEVRVFWLSRGRYGTFGSKSKK